MKNTKLLLGLFLIALFGVFTACEETTEEDLTPTLNFTGGGDNVADDATLTAGEFFTVGITALSNSSSGAKLESFMIVRTFNNVPTTVYDTTFADRIESFNAEFEIQANTAEGDERFTFTITDKDGEFTEKAFVITTEPPAGGAINTYTAKLLGAHQNPSAGSFLNTADGSVYLVADAKNNQASVDIVYYFGATNQATLAAPDDAGAAEFNVYDLDNWSTKNATRFTSTLSGVDFDAVVDDTEIIANVTDASSSKANQLAVGDIIGFKTADNRLGLISVKSINTGTEGDITIDVKVQQ